MTTVNEERVVDNITICVSKFENMFFGLPDSHLKVEMISKRVKRGREFGFKFLVIIAGLVKKRL